MCLLFIISGGTTSWLSRLDGETWSAMQSVQELSNSASNSTDVQSPGHQLVFSDLPPELKLRIFSLLSATERGIGARVCRDWRALMRVSTLWAVIDTSQLPVCTAVHSHGSLCRTAQRRRVCQFLVHVGNTRAVVRRLCIWGDICDTEWRTTLESFFSIVRLHELMVAQLKWFSDSSNDILPETNERARRAQRHFVSVFETFTRVAPKVSTLILPFDWSDRSVQLLLNLSHLNTLVLEKYFTYQGLTQSSLDSILVGLPNLRRLHLEVWIASGHGSVAFTIASTTLEFLDLSQCRGFDLAFVNLPCLSVIKLSRVYPWHGSLVVRNDAGVDVCHPCVREVLAYGASNLRVINEHKLNPQWTNCSANYSELELVLSAVCSCAKHRVESWEL